MANTCTFDELHSKAKRGIVCDGRRLIQVDNNWRTETAKEKFTEQVDRNLRDLGGGRRIAQFYIGMALVDKKDEATPLDQRDPSTWDLSGINIRWNEHRRRDYNGLIVLTVVSRDVVKGTITIDKQDYALMLEQLLLYHYKVDKRDVKLQNETFAQGGRGDNSDGYAVYVAVKLE